MNENEIIAGGNEMYSIGVDVGGTNTEVGLVDSQGNILRHEQFATLCESFDSWAEMLAELVEKMVQAVGKESIRGIGIGAPTANTDTGIVEGATNLNWPRVTPLASEIEKRTGIRTVIANDANAAAMGEMKYGVARGMRNFIMLTLGTGVGAGVVVDGHLLSGANGFAGELGHVQFGFLPQRTCSCGRTGCLECVASAKGIIWTAEDLLNEHKDEASELRDLSTDELTPRRIGDCAKRGDALSREVFRYTGECIGRACASFAAFADPEAVILFGGIAKSGDMLLAPALSAFNNDCLHLYRDRVRFLVSSIPESEAALLGAASLPIK